MSGEANMQCRSNELRRRKARQNHAMSLLFSKNAYKAEIFHNYSRKLSNWSDLH